MELAPSKWPTREQITRTALTCRTDCSVTSIYAVHWRYATRGSGPKRASGGTTQSSALHRVHPAVNAFFAHRPAPVGRLVAAVLFGDSSGCCQGRVGIAKALWGAFEEQATPKLKPRAHWRRRKRGSAALPPHFIETTARPGVFLLRGGGLERIFQMTAINCQRLKQKTIKLFPLLSVTLQIPSAIFMP